MLKVTTVDDRRGFQPGETVEGGVAWQLEKPPRSVQLRLFWYTRGKGTQDVGVIETVGFDNPGQQDERPFSVRIPQGPYSFSGSLVSLVWALELVAQPGAETERIDITVSPTGREIVLKAVPDEKSALRDRVEGFIRQAAGRYDDDAR